MRPGKTSDAIQFGACVHPSGKTIEILISKDGTAGDLNDNMAQGDKAKPEDWI